MQKERYQLNDLLDIMRALRDPDSGCPWDLKQNYQSIVPHTLEEAYEVADAIEQGDFEELKGELGDLLFQVVFYCQLATEENRFDIADVIHTVSEKLVRRHPHVFSNADFSDDAQIKANWEAEKAKERAQKSESEFNSVLDNVPTNLPALTRANKLQKRCASVGFDWPDINGAIDKVKEEIAELEVELAQKDHDAQQKALIAEELGDLMFALVNVNRKLKLDPETTLRAANQKFEKRFRKIEILASKKYTDDFAHLSLQQMEALWQQVKSEAKDK
ncbi:nucleoside triphosphate pyrophosphohydrolase [Catenovulum sediminis]|uniref:nucleoside triphosphate pyrophosphohydrolase n=1 Tax=Catenovulum sediminis TaxID=1740262 RepID=UPI00117CB2C6|nr:nucleoside triphosphate pyrophosphohydrolase [Catenovulum sediminis]